MIKVAISICSVLFGVSAIGTGIALLFLFVLTTTLFNPLLLLLISAPIAVLSLIGLAITLVWNYRIDSANQAKAASPKTKGQVIEAKPPVQANQVVQSTPSPLANQGPESKPIPIPTPTPEEKKLALSNLKNFFEADFSTQNIEDFWKILNELDDDEKISAIKKITSTEKRELFVHCMKNGSSLDKLFAFLPKEISIAQKDEIKHAVWITIYANNEFFKKILINTEMEKKLENKFLSEKEITYNPNFLYELIRIFPEHETDIIEKIFQNDASVYQNILNYLWYEKNASMGECFSSRHWPFFTAIHKLKSIQDHIKSIRNSSKKEQEEELIQIDQSIQYFISICQTLHFTQRPFLKKMIDQFLLETPEEKIKALGEQLGRVDGIFYRFLNLGDLDGFAPNDIYHINKYFKLKKEVEILYSHSEMEEKILEKIISNERFFTHLIKNMTDALHILKQISNEQKIRFINAMMEAQSGKYFIGLMPNVVDLHNLLNFLTNVGNVAEAEDAVKAVVESNPHFSHEDFFTGQNCRFKNFSRGYALDFIYTKTIGNSNLFAKFIDDYDDLHRMASNFEPPKKISAFKILLSTEQTQRFKNCIKDAFQLEEFCKNLHFLGKNAEEGKNLISLLWIIIDSDLSFFEKTMIRSRGSASSHVKYRKKLITFKSIFLLELLEIFPNYENKIFEKLFSCKLETYRNTLGFLRFFDDNSPFLANSFFADHRGFIEGVVALIALKYYINKSSEEKDRTMDSLKAISQKITQAEQPLFLKVLNDIFPKEREEKTKISHWVKQPFDNSSRSIPVAIEDASSRIFNGDGYIPTPIPSVYTAGETNNPEVSSKNPEPPSENPEPPSNPRQNNNT